MTTKPKLHTITTTARQRTNARNNAAKASRERHKRAKAGYDADAGIARLRAIFDELEGK